MGAYSKHKEDLATALDKLNKLGDLTLGDAEKKEAFDRYNTQAQRAAAKLKDYGLGKVFRFQTPKGVFYLVDIDKTDIPELMKDLMVESYHYTEMNAREIIKL